MNDAILEILTWINDIILGLSTNGSNLTGSMRSFMPQLYDYTNLVMTNVVLPVAYTILALFFVFELYNASIRTEGMGGGTANLGAEMVFKVMFKMILCKVAVDSVPLILNAIYEVTTHITTGVAGVMGGGSITGGGIDIEALEPVLEAFGFWTGLVALVMCLIVFLVSMIAVVLANIIIVTRFIELFIYFAIAPIPIATFPSAEMSSIGKNFLKNFAAVSVQGTLIFIVLSFFPVLFNNAFLNNGAVGEGLFGALAGVLGYSIVLILAVFSTGRWAKSITHAM